MKVYTYPRDLPAPCAVCGHLRRQHRSFADPAIRPSPDDYVCDACLSDAPLRGEYGGDDVETTARYDEAHHPYEDAEDDQ